MPGKLENGLTNKLWKDDKTIIKFYSDSAWPVHVMSALHIGFFEQPVYHIDRMANEIQAREQLAELGIAVPPIRQNGDNWTEQKFIPGRTLDELLDSNNTHRCFQAGMRIGSILETVHRNGGALLDARTSNFIVTDKTAWSIDHEFYQTDATQLQQELDALTLLSTALAGEQKAVETFLDGLNARYPELLQQRKGIAHILGLFSLIAYTAIQHRSPRLLAWGLRNWLIDLLPTIRGKT